MSAVWQPLVTVPGREQQQQQQDQHEVLHQHKANDVEALASQYTGVVQVHAFVTTAPAFMQSLHSGLTCNGCCADLLTCSNEQECSCAEELCQACSQQAPCASWCICFMKQPHPALFLGQGMVQR